MPARFALAIIALAMLLCAVFFALNFVELSNDIAVMLPEDELIRKNVQFFQESPMFGGIIISLSAQASVPDSRQKLMEAADMLALSLDPDLFSDVTSGISGRDLQEFERLVDSAPEILDANDLKAIASVLNKEDIGGRLRSYYLQLLKPGGVFLSRYFTSDPINIRGAVSLKLQKNIQNSRFRAQAVDGHFFSDDGRHILITANSRVKVTDADGSRRLIKAIENSMRTLPEGIEYDVMAGHYHTEYNERVIKRDIKLTLLLGSVMFLLLLVFVFRGFSAIIVYVLPAVALLFAIDLTFVLTSQLAYPVIGLSAIITGISVDYGIHVFVALKCGGRRRMRSVKAVARPLALSVLTTIGIFISFFLSSVSGHHQMAVLAILSIVFSAALALIVMPVFVRPGGAGPSMAFTVRTSFSRRVDALALAIWALVLVVCFLFALNLEFMTSMKHLDATGGQVLEAEARVKNTWGGQNIAMLVQQSDSYAGANEAAQESYDAVSEAIGAENVSGLSPLWGSKARRLENANRWNSFWSDGKAELLVRLIDQEGGKTGFAQGAFNPFIEKLNYDTSRVDVDNHQFKMFGNFIFKAGEKYLSVLYFDDSDDIIASVSAGLPAGAYIVSAKTLERASTEASSRDMKVMFMVSSLLVLILTTVFLRKPLLVAITLVPVISSVVCMLGVITIMGQKINVANIMGAIIVIGLSVDYGIFMTLNFKKDSMSYTALSVSLSAFSTLIGSGVLIMTEHPALYSVGEMLSVGIIFAYLSAVFVVPALFRLTGASADE